jgi:hypothetical protein
MTEFSGTASSKVQSQTVIAAPGQEDRQLSMAILVGAHSSSDQKFDKSHFTYGGTADTVNGNGEQIGYFQNVHTNGDTSFGTFAAKVTAPGGVLTLEGNWQFTGGTGSLSGLKGSGPFQAAMTSPTASEMTWSGSYEVG